MDGGEIRDDTMEDGLTIFFKPYINGNVNYYERNCDRDSFKVFADYIRELEGGEWFNRYYSLKTSSFEKQISLKVEYEGNKYEIGHYLPLRNIILMYVPIKYNWELGINNKYILEIIKYIKEIFENFDIKHYDVAKAKEEILLNKFTREIKRNIDTLTEESENSANYVEEYNIKIVEWYRKISFDTLRIESLKIFLGQIKDGLSKKVEEIRKLKFVKEAGLTNDGLIIKFEEIFIKDRGKDIRMGNYTITLFPNKISIVNDEPVVRQRTKYHSPHISENNICFGGQRAMANKLLGELEFKKLTHFLWLYLNGYNEGDTYLPMRDWIAGRNNNNVVPEEHEDEEEEEGYDEEEEGYDGE